MTKLDPDFDTDLAIRMASHLRVAANAIAIVKHQIEVEGSTWDVQFETLEQVSDLLKDIANIVGDAFKGRVSL